MSDNLERYYLALGLRPGASPHEVRRAYRDLVKVWHPDRFADERLKQKAEEKLKEINEAYNRLKHARPSQPKDSTTAHRAQERKRGAASPHRTPSQVSRDPRQRGNRQQQPVRKRVVLAAALGGVLLFTAIWYVTEATLPYLSEWVGEELSTRVFEALESETTGDEPDPQDATTRKSGKKQRGWSETQIVLPRLLPVRYFTVGSTREEVEAIQGAPERVTGDTFHYGTSRVFFHDGRVVSWNNSYPRLKVQLRPTSPTTKTHYTVGSTKDEVIAIQGTPDRFTETVFHYGMSEVRLQNGRVAGWTNRYPRLKVELLPVTATAKSRFTVGSTKDEVLAIQGTPDSFTDEAFRYGTSEVLFQNGRVVSWTNGFPLLKIESMSRG